MPCQPRLHLQVGAGKNSVSKDNSSTPLVELESKKRCSSHPKNLFGEVKRKTENLPYDCSTTFSYLGSQKARHLPPTLWWTAVITPCKPQRTQCAFPAHHWHPTPRDCRTRGVVLTLILMLHAGQANFHGLSVLWLSTQHTTGVTLSATHSKVT